MPTSRETASSTNTNEECAGSISANNRAQEIMPVVVAEHTKTRNLYTYPGVGNWKRLFRALEMGSNRLFKIALSKDLT